MPLESRRIAAFLLTHPDDTAWRRALIEDNLLQKKAPATALRQASLIRNRLNTLDETAWDMIAHREQEVAIQLLLVAAIRHSQLLSDFINDVYKDLSDSTLTLEEQLATLNANMASTLGQTQKAIAGLRQEAAVAFPTIVG